MSQVHILMAMRVCSSSCEFCRSVCALRRPWTHDVTACKRPQLLLMVRVCSLRRCVKHTPRSASGTENFCTIPVQFGARRLTAVDSCAVAVACMAKYQNTDVGQRWRHAEQCPLSAHGLCTIRCTWDWHCAFQAANALQHQHDSCHPAPTSSLRACHPVKGSRVVSLYSTYLVAVRPSAPYHCGTYAPIQMASPAFTECQSPLSR